MKASVNQRGIATKRPQPFVHVGAVSMHEMNHVGIVVDYCGPERGHADIAFVVQACRWLETAAQDKVDYGLGSYKGSIVKSGKTAGVAERRKTQ